VIKRNSFTVFESKQANSCFDRLFRAEKEDARKSVIVDADTEVNSTVNKEAAKNDLFNQIFYANILSRARELLVRKEQRPQNLEADEDSYLENKTLPKSDNSEKHKNEIPSRPKRVTKQSEPGKTLAQQLLADILTIECNPIRTLPGRPDVQTTFDRLAIGLDCDEVLPGVILASGKTVKNVAYMRELGITHIINTANRDVWLPLEKLSNLGVQIFQFHVDDVPSAKIAPFFRPVAEFVAEVKKSGGMLVINCLVGLSRSATVLAAAMMINNKWSARRSLEMLRWKREIKPNLGFLGQLLTLEKELGL